LNLNTSSKVIFVDAPWADHTTPPSSPDSSCPSLIGWEESEDDLPELVPAGELHKLKACKSEKAGEEAKGHGNERVAERSNYQKRAAEEEQEKEKEEHKLNTADKKGY
jgi:hypothetical protein